MLDQKGLGFLRGVMRHNAVIADLESGEGVGTRIACDQLVGGRFLSALIFG